MEIINLGSGSKGNATLLIHNETRILIDFGISFSTYKNNIDQFTKLDGILITHEHSDHIKGLPRLLGNVDTKLYLNKETYNGISPKIKDGILTQNVIFIEDYFSINDIDIETIKISHDTNNPIGFIIRCCDKKIVYLTDLGVYYQKDECRIQNADMYMIESNYDPIMLTNSSRPYFLKNRISGLKGHLSNKEASFLLTKVVGDRTKNIMLMHLSNECNTEELALATLLNTFKVEKIHLNANVICANQFDFTKLNIK